MLGQSLHALPPKDSFEGSGLYCIYYRGDYPLYKAVSEANHERWTTPIYVGKAVPKGARKGESALNPKPGHALINRLQKHARTITEAENLALDDFRCQYLVVEDIWIALGEATLVQHFRPLWNVIVDGFGNNDPGKGRYGQLRSQWDTLHPGRSWALKCQERTDDPSTLARRITEYGARPSKQLKPE